MARALRAALVITWIAAIAAFAATSGALDGISGPLPRAGATRGANRGRAEFGARAERAVSATATQAWELVRLPLGGCALLGGASVLSRTAFRRRRLRRGQRYEIRLGREDTASPYKREKLFDAWHGQLSVR